MQKVFGKEWFAKAVNRPLPTGCPFAQNDRSQSIAAEFDEGK